MVKTVSTLVGCSAAIVLAAAAAGCVPSSSADGLPISLPGVIFNIAVGDFAVDADVTESGTNIDFAAADPATLTLGRTLVITGQIDGIEDVDVYNLGPLAAGTRVVVDADGVLLLDTQVTLFDEDENFFAFNDDRNPEEGEYDPLIDHVLRYPTTTTYLVIEMDFLAKVNENHETGAYEIQVTASPGQPIPPTQPQNLVINFEGTSFVAIKDFYYGSVPPFDPYLIHRDYEDQRDTFITRIMGEVREDFEGFSVAVYRSTDPDVPWPNVSTVHVGGADQGLFGIANDVDLYNAQTMEDAVVYAESFTMLIRDDGDLPSTTAMAQAIANVVTHESGHLLGLRHTILDPSEVMQTTSTVDELMLDESFGTARLDYHALGNQNTRKLLLYTVGGDPDVLARRRPNLKPFLEAAKRAQVLGSPIIHKSMLGTCRCRRCTAR